MRPQVQNGQTIFVESTGGAAKPLWVMGDAVRLEQVRVICSGMPSNMPPRVQRIDVRLRRVDDVAGAMA